MRLQAASAINIINTAKAAGGGHKMAQPSRFNLYKASVADTSKRPKAESKGKPTRYDEMSKAELAKELVKLKREVNRALKLAKQG